MKGHRLLNPFQFESTPVTRQEASLIDPYVTEPGEKDEDTPFGYRARWVVSLSDLHREKILK
jgi:hypothetical protein